MKYSTTVRGTSSEDQELARYRRAVRSPLVTNRSALFRRAYRCARGVVSAGRLNNGSRDRRGGIALWSSSCAIAMIGVLLGIACGGGGGGEKIAGPGNPAAPTASSITVSQDTATLVPAASVQLSATAKDAGGQTLSRTVSWASSDNAKATVSTSGLVTGVSAGPATITASADGKSASATVTVRDGGVAPAAGASITAASGAVLLVVPAGALATSTSLTVAPAAVMPTDPRIAVGSAYDFGPVGLVFAAPVSLTIRYDATRLPPGTPEAKLQLALLTPTGWQAVSGATANVTAKTVSAPVAHFSTYAVMTPPAEVTAATVTLSLGASVLAVGDSTMAAAVVKDVQGTILTGRTVTYASSSTAATVSPDGRVKALVPGSATITATADGKSGSATLTIASAGATAASVTLTLRDSVLAVGDSTTATVVVKDAQGGILTGRAVTFTSSSTAAAVSPSGLVKALVQGSATITATADGKSGSAILTTLTPSVTAIYLDSQGLTGAKGSNGLLHASIESFGPLPVVTWATSDPSIATVTPVALTTGGFDTTRGSSYALITYLRAGPLAVSVTAGGKTAVTPLNYHARVTDDTKTTLNVYTRVLSDSNKTSVTVTAGSAFGISSISAVTPYFGPSQSLVCSMTPPNAPLTFTGSCSGNPFFGVNGGLNVSMFTTGPAGAGGVAVLVAPGDSASNFSLVPLRASWIVIGTKSRDAAGNYVLSCSFPDVPLGTTGGFGVATWGTAKARIHKSGPSDGTDSDVTTTIDMGTAVGSPTISSGQVQSLPASTETVVDPRGYGEIDKQWTTISALDSRGAAVGGVNVRYSCL